MHSKNAASVDGRATVPKPVITAALGKVDAMRNIILIMAFLLVPFFGLAPFGVDEVSRGRIATTCVFVFTGIGHFLQSEPMSAMIPLRVPKPFRLPIIYASGVFEIVAAIAVLVPGWSSAVGLLLCLFLVGILPANIDAAIRRVPFGGHGAGPSYLLARVPLQILLLGWIYWFELRPAVWGNVPSITSRFSHRVQARELALSADRFVMLTCARHLVGPHEDWSKTWS